MHLAKSLSYYKQPSIQHQLIEAAHGKEVGVRFVDSFGPRPDVLRYPGEILDLAKRRATSFHGSEELWHNPLHLKPGLHKAELDELRKGWDFILDIDCPDWEISKYLTYALIDALLVHRITSVSVKFSGNKGFHIGVPFEAFPSEFSGQPIAHLFPQAPKAMAHYLLKYVAAHNLRLEGNTLHFTNGPTRTIESLATALGKPFDALVERRCASCGTKVTHVAPVQIFICPACGTNVPKNAEYLLCPKDGTVMQSHTQAPCACSKPDITTQLNHLAIVEADTLLLSVRHLYRLPYSLHEKSGLVSLPIPRDSVRNFERTQAEPAQVCSNHAHTPFLDRTSVPPGEATFLLTAAYEDLPSRTQQTPATQKEYVLPAEALPSRTFPPCILKLVEGTKDGRKRSLFILVNFLRSAGYDVKSVQDHVATWNQKNAEPLRDLYIEAHLRHHLAQSKPSMPPNCKSSYEELLVCAPDNLCARIKNPLQYARRKALYAEKPIDKPVPTKKAIDTDT